jgi:hypothetical protein
MSTLSSPSVLDRVLSPVASCLTPDVAQQIVDLQLDAQAQSQLDDLRGKAKLGTLTDAEREEYEEFVDAIDLVAILKAKARAVVKAAS